MSIAGGRECQAQTRPSFRTFFGVARGGGDVHLSPRRGSHFRSPDSSDLAFAMTSGALPAAYTLTIRASNIDIEDTGCRFGIFDHDARWGGSNDDINELTKFSVVFQAHQDKREIYVISYAPNGDYSCWDGKSWVANAWTSTGVQWQPDLDYSIAIRKTLDEFQACVKDKDRSVLLEATAPIAEIRGAASPDYFALGDLVTDFVAGELAVSSVTIDEKALRPYLDQDIRRAAIREAPKGRYAMYGGLTQLNREDIICVYKVGSVDETGNPWTVRDEHIVWTMSTDGGHSWQESPQLIYKDPENRQENCCGTGYVTEDGVFMHPFYALNADYEERAKEENWSKLYLAVSDDELKTWDIRELETPFQIAASFGGIVELTDGRLLLNCYGAVEKGSFRHQAGYLVSHDQGKSWGDYTLIGADSDPEGGPARLNETDIAELPDGRLVSMSRTQYAGFPLYRGVSEDGGTTWVADRSELTGLCPTLCYSPAGPPEGTLVMAYHDRWGDHSDHGGVYVAFSHDGGESWGEPTWISGGAYPCIIETKPGTVLCSYYRSNSLLQASVFDIPFPTGLHATGGIPDSSKPGVRLQWDKYHGKGNTDLTYRVYRSVTADFETTEENLIATVRDVEQYNDTDTVPGRVYFYRVTAHDNDRQLGTSWIRAARSAR